MTNTNINMSDKKPEALTVVEDLNGELQDKFGDNYFFDEMYVYISDGFHEYIKFGRNFLWSSDNEERDFDEGANEYEPLKPFIKEKFRYALGRNTYACDTVSDAIVKNWGELKQNTKGIIIKEIRQAIDTNNAGMQCDIDAWKRVLELLDAEIIHECGLCGGDTSKLGFCPKCDTDCYNV